MGLVSLTCPKSPQTQPTVQYSSVANVVFSTVLEQTSGCHIYRDVHVSDVMDYNCFLYSEVCETIMTACTPHGNAMFQGRHGNHDLEALNRQMKMLEDLVREVRTVKGRWLIRIVMLLPLLMLQLMHVNSQWDLEYREQEEAFRRYREDSQLATKENHETIARLRRRTKR